MSTTPMLSCIRALVLCSAISSAPLVGAGVRADVAFTTHRVRRPATQRSGTRARVQIPTGGTATAALVSKHSESLSAAGLSLAGPKLMGGAHEFWHRFREIYQQHIQGIALGSIPSGGTALVVAEPPPTVTLRQLSSVSPGILLEPTVETHQIGHDGWVKDVTFTVQGDRRAVDSAISALNRLLFGTAYKSYLLPLVPRAALKPAEVDVHVSAQDLQRWVLGDDARFVPTLGGAPRRLQNVVNEARSTTYFVSGHPIAAWWIPKAVEFKGCRTQARMFALDSDLIIGGISRPAGLLVLGRERMLPVSVLPPLRAETLEVLASAKNDELAQSYERHHILAGRLDASKDWAPIYLSPNLVDTEYGSLLNIADQLLKSWSNHGLTRYEHFLYPNPSSYPFTKSVVSELGGEGRLVYNWNTAGAGYSIKYGAGEIFALSRTGCLPVTYIPSGQESDATQDVLRAEDTAYRYYGGLGNPELARVVQYVAFYQMCHAYRQAGPANAPRRHSDQRLRDLTYQELLKVRSLAALDLKALAQQIAVFWSRAGAKGTIASLTASATEQLGELRNDLTSQSLAEVRTFADDLCDGGIIGLIVESEYRPILRAVARLHQVGLKYSAAVRPTAPWIHTPSIVVSWNTGELSDGIGGHNIDAAITRLSVSSEVPIGKPRVTRSGREYVVQVNPADAEAAAAAVRELARRRQDPEAARSALEGALKSAKTPPLRSPEVALGGGGAPPSGTNRGFRPSGGEGEPPRWGWKTGGQPLPPGDPVLLALSRDRSEGHTSIIVERGVDGTARVIHDQSASPIHAASMDDASDAVAELLRTSPAGRIEVTRVHLLGVTPDEGEAFIRSCELRAAEGKVRPEIYGLVHGKGVPLEDASGLLTHQHDYARAVVKERPDITVGADGASVSRIDVEIPHKDAAFGGTEMDVELAFAKQATKSKIVAIRSRVAKGIRRVLGLPQVESQFVTKMRAEIRQVQREQPELTRFATRLKTKAGPITIVVLPLTPRKSYGAGASGTRGLYAASLPAAHRG